MIEWVFHLLWSIQVIPFFHRGVLIKGLPIKTVKQACCHQCLLTVSSLKYTQPKWHAATCCMWHPISLAVGDNECDRLKIQHTGNLSSPSSKRMRMLGRGTERLREAAPWWPPDVKLHLLWPMWKTFCLKNKMYLDPLLCEMERVVDMGQSLGLRDWVSFTTLWSSKIFKNLLFFQSKHFARYEFQ